jgi:putative molybdopterin biosynthesis protein
MEKALSTQEVADLLDVSKNTIYELIKRGDLHSYKVGRKMRFSQEDVKAYIAQSKKQSEKKAAFISPESAGVESKNNSGFIICGQDLILDILSNYMRLHGIPALRAYIGSYDSLVSLYRDKINVASAHLWDSETGEYNVPYVKRLLPGIPAVIVHLTCRNQGLYVLKGNPKNIVGWADFGRPDIRMINREHGAGSRVLLDENLKLLGIYGSSINGYTKETQSHLAVASAVSSGSADVGVGSEKIAKQVDNIDFIPLKKERYDLVVKKEHIETPEIKTMFEIIRSPIFKQEFSNIGGYDTSDMGTIVAET